MATETHEETIPEVDPDESPFELQAIDGLPLTDEERREAKRFLAELERERTSTT
jgi:hypothetical protein